jgi:hypothetical protein
MLETKKDLALLTLARIFIDLFIELHRIMQYIFKVNFDFLMKNFSLSLSVSLILIRKRLLGDKFVFLYHYTR